MPRAKLDSAPGTPIKFATNNAADPSGRKESPNETIMKLIQEAYSDKDAGVEMIAKQVGLPEIIAPHRKTTILLCGNHSSGKSSFINWYLGEHIQKTGVAMETAAFTIITQGSRRETFKGAASLEFWPRLATELKGVRGVPDYLQTEFSVSEERKFSMINFIDTPGLVDGHAEYPYPVEDILSRLAHIADLVYIFLDPMGKAGCKRTLMVAETLVRSQELRSKMRFFLTKADTLVDALDRQKVIVQVTQNLTSVLNTVNFDLPTIFIPTGSEEHRYIPNSIESVCKEMEDTISQSVQNAIVSLGADCQKVFDRIGSILDTDKQQREKNSTLRFRAFMLISIALACFSLPLLLLARWGVRIAGMGELDQLGGGAFVSAAAALYDNLDDSLRHYLVGGLVVVFLLLAIAGSFTLRGTTRTLASHRLAQLREHQARLVNVMGKKQELYDKFFSSVRYDNVPATPTRDMTPTPMASLKD